ncbi:hypothetical protein D3C85_1850130 [compost metagenome]
MLPGAPVASLIRSRYCGAVMRGIGPTSAAFVPPGDAPPAAPSVNSHALPRASATSAWGPAAAWACAMDG